MKDLKIIIDHLEDRDRSDADIYNLAPGAPKGQEEAEAIMKAISSLRKADSRLINILKKEI